MNTLLIRADATSEIGAGHVMRCLALAQAWQDKGRQVVFISHCDSAALRNRITAEGITLISLDKPHPDPFDLDFTISTLNKLRAQNVKGKTWLVVDGYHFDADYQKSIKAAGYKLLWIDDYGHAEHYWADLILNQNIAADPSRYKNREPYTRLLLGTRYALLRREFKRWQGWQHEIPAMALKVLVTLGGGDPGNVTLQVIQALKQVKVPGLEAQIVIGPANPHLPLLQQAIGEDSRLHLLRDVTDMSDLMAWADISISAGGSTCWEQAFMGLPCLIIVTAENQRANADELDRERVGINLGWYQDLSAERIASHLQKLVVNSELRSLMSQRGQNLVDGYGGGRLCKIMADEALRLRPVLPGDVERVWKWANDATVRAASFSEAFIEWEEHVRWFQARIKRPWFYIALNQDDVPVGQVRFDQNGAETVISVMIAADWRQRGYGVTLIRTACEEIFFNSDVTTIHAYLKPDNEASRLAFIKAGFKETGAKIQHGYPAAHFILVKG